MLKMFEARQHGECVLHLGQADVDEGMLRQCLQGAFTQPLRFLDTTTVVCDMTAYNTMADRLNLQVRWYIPSGGVLLLTFMFLVASLASE
jgi:hypothetical protein